MLLDTSLAIDFLRGERGAVDRLRAIFEAGDDPYVNDVVLCEIAVGLRDGDDPAFSAFVRAVAFVQPGPDAPIRAGRWRREAARRGRTLSLSDALIAAAADEIGAVILTRNSRDFQLAPVRTETY